MALSKAALWVVMAMVVLTTLACAAMVLLGRSETELYYFYAFTLLSLALLAPIVVTLHRAPFRAGGVVVCAIFLFFWAGMVAAMMHPTFLEYFSSTIMESVYIVFLMGLPAGVGLMCVGRPWGKWFAWTLAAVTALCLPVCLVGVWGGQYAGGEYFGKLTMSGGFCFCYLASGSPLLVNVGRHDRRYFRWPGIAAAIAATVIGLIALWKYDIKYDDTTIWNFVTHALWIFCATLALINLLLMTRRAGLVRSLQWTAIILTGLSGAALIAWLWVNQDFQYGPYCELVYRLTGVTMTLAAGTIVAMLVARTMLRLKPKPAAPTGITQVKLHCPVCGTLQDMGLNEACHKCLVQFHITLVEPHCPACQLIILNLTSDHCPKCGQAIRRPTPISPALTPADSQEKM